MKATFRTMKSQNYECQNNPNFTFQIGKEIVKLFLTKSVFKKSYRKPKRLDPASTKNARLCSTDCQGIYTWCCRAGAQLFWLEPEPDVLVYAPQSTYGSGSYQQFSQNDDLWQPLLTVSRLQFCTSVFYSWSQEPKLKPEPNRTGSAYWVILVRFVSLPSSWEILNCG